MTKIILFNGPPSSGKDTIGSMVQAQLSSEYKLFTDVTKFAAPLKRTACSLYCEGDQTAWHQFDAPGKKDEASETFFGKTPREIQIAISEDFMKPLHGTSVFGKLLVHYIQKASPRFEGFLVTDSGFRPEAEELVTAFGAENIILIRLNREGATYEGDSRGYINLDDLGVKSIDLDNEEGSPNGAVTKILNEVASFFKSDKEQLNAKSA